MKLGEALKHGSETTDPGGTPRPPTSMEQKIEARENINLGKFILIIGQLLLLALIIRQFQIQSSAFLRVALLAFAGFSVHYFLPLRHRLTLFSLLSVLSIFIVFGIKDGCWLIGLGVLLIGICHLPVAFWQRITILSSVCALFMLFRIGILEGPWSSAIWPILGSMFIFRIVVYLYDIRHEKTPATISQRLGYFFMAPNVCFPMFPVVDYTEFRRTYYNDERHRIYQVGVDWMIRGIIHLILYRLIYQYLTITPTEVTNPDTLVQFLITNFLLYLRISGYFHLITGMLHLFGFNILATHHRYCLASSFTDFWRRINIYWKDFMMKLIYYPIMFKLRGLGQAKALVIATLVVFLTTWLLHSWLWFWLRGSFPIIWQDAFFWGVLALVVIINSLMEIKKGRNRSIKNKDISIRNSLIIGLKTIGIFFFICTLWSIWTTESFSAWISMWAFLWNDSLSLQQALPRYLLAVSAVIFISAIYFGRASRGQESDAERSLLQKSPFKLSTLSMLVLVTMAGMPQVYTQLDSDTASLIFSLKSNRLSKADESNLERGYYEQLTRVDKFNSQLWELYMNKPTLHWLDIKGEGLGRFTGDFLQEELTPNSVSVSSYGEIRTNSWGMRDQEYKLQPPPGAYRVAVLGASSVMGWGVNQDETFEAITEERLNQQGGVGEFSSVEFLNFAVPGYYPLQQYPVLEKAKQFQPSAIFYIATGREQERSLSYLTSIVKKGIKIPYPKLRDIVSKAKVDSSMDESTIKRQLIPYQVEVLNWLYSELVVASNSMGATPVWVFLPAIEKGSWLETLQTTEHMARKSGFMIINLNGVFDKHKVEDLQLEKWDKHPNKLGHQLVAEAIYDAVNNRWTELRVK